MIIVMKPNAEESAVKKIITKIEEKGLHTHLSQGEEVLIIGVVGDKSKLDTNAICALPSVEKIVPITESYKLSNKKFHPEPMEFSVGSTKIGYKQHYDHVRTMCRRDRGTAFKDCPCR